ncbi:MAG: response regulator transcription factor [Bacteroidota bacterium]
MSDFSKILVIEDEPRLAQMLKRGLNENDFIADNAFDGQQGFDMFKNGNFDAIVLDINLPLINGFEVCKMIREINSRIPIIMLTAFGTTNDKLTGFDSGADDYMVKPFEFQELLARLRVFLKRNRENKTPEDVLQIEDLEMNITRKEVFRSNKKVELTAKEFALLEYLIRNKNRVISRIELAEKVWDINFDTGTNVIDVYINYLRKKVDKNFKKKLIQTIVGMGYVIKD